MPSFAAIPTGKLAEVFDLHRRSQTRDDIGDFSETWGAVYSGIPVIMMPLTILSGVTEYQQEEGVEYQSRTAGYINMKDIPAPPKNHDRLVGQGMTYLIISVQTYSTSVGHHHYRIVMHADEPNS